MIVKDVGYTGCYDLEYNRSLGKGIRSKGREFRTFWSIEPQLQPSKSVHDHAALNLPKLNRSLAVARARVEVLLAAHG